MATDVDGSTWLLDLDEYVDARHYLFGGYEDATLDALALEATRRGCTRFFDIGAHAGLYSVKLPLRCPSLRQVDSFEPLPRSRAQLFANLFLNGRLTLVRVNGMALSDRSGPVSLHVPGRPVPVDGGKTNFGTCSLEHREGRHQEVITVQACPLDSVFEGEAESVAVKIDVEGHELSVLRGMERFLSANRCVLSVEIFPERLETVVRWFGDRGYRRLVHRAAAAEGNFFFGSD